LTRQPIVLTKKDGFENNARGQPAHQGGTTS
jgi:hypothetical protein